MSCYYKALPRLVTELVLSAGSSSEVAIVSPWIENVTLLPPKFGTDTVRYIQSQITFSDFFVRMVRDFNFHLLFLSRPGDQRTQKTLRPIVNAAPSRVLIKEFDYIHAKIIVTPYFAIETTANMIPTSLSRNIESCTLVRNTFINTRKYITHKLGDII
jgi:hypothetical protein